MLKLEPNFTWKQFEIFHANWECLRRSLLGEHASTLPEFYLMPKDMMSLSKRKKKLPKISFSKKERVEALQHDLRNEDIKQHKDELIEDGQELVLMPKNLNNPGFDALALEKLEGGNGLAAICFEMKFSNPGAKTTLDQEDVDEKWELTKEAFKGTGPTPFLVVAAWRDHNLDKIQQGGSVIVLNKEDLERLFTPSLATRPQFILSKLKKQQGENENVEEDDEEDEEGEEESKAKPKTTKSKAKPKTTERKRSSPKEKGSRRKKS